MDNEFSILDDYWMQMFMINLKASDALYHLLGGKESHKVVRCQHRCNGWGWGDEYGEIISHEMLAKDQFGLNHAMTIRFIDDLSELEDIKEHPLGDVWEYQENGKDYFCRPATHMLVYFLNDTLPEDKLACKVGFLLIADDLDINVELPTQIISTEVDDGSELSNLVQYLKCPTCNRTEYGALADRVDVLLNAWETRKREAEG